MIFVWFFIAITLFVCLLAWPDSPLINLHIALFKWIATFSLNMWIPIEKSQTKHFLINKIAQSLSWNDPQIGSKSESAKIINEVLSSQNGRQKEIQKQWNQSDYSHWKLIILIIFMKQLNVHCLNNIEIIIVLMIWNCEWVYTWVRPLTIFDRLDFK